MTSVIHRATPRRRPFFIGAALVASAACGGEKTTAPKTPPGPQDVSFTRTSTYRGPARLMIAAVGATDPTPITPAAEQVGAAYSWAPDGKSVAYANSVRGVHVIGRDGSGEHLLAGSDTVPIPTYIAWSPDGRSIAASDGSTLWIFPSGGGTPVVVRPSVTQGVNFPAWSPDSRRIAFTSGNNQLGVVAASTGIVQLFTNVNAAAHPDWSPDGTEIALESGPPYGIYTVNADGTQLRPVVPQCPSGSACEGRVLQFPHWSSDGLRFAVFVYPSDVGVLNVDGSNVRIVSALRNNFAYTHPGWSRDGHVVFLADRTGLPKPFVMSADTTQITGVTSGGFYDDIPRWVP
jgi:Tol biopolymer transport system component